MSATEKILKILTQNFSPIHLEIKDQHENHKNHPEAKRGGGHYQIILVSEAFSKKTLIEQHRMVNDALKDLFGSEIHALSLRTYSLNSWEQEKIGGGNG